MAILAVKHGTTVACITLLYNFTTALLYMVSLVTMATIVSRLLNIYQTVKIKN